MAAARVAMPGIKLPRRAYQGFENTLESAVTFGQLKKT